MKKDTRRSLLTHLVDRIAIGVNVAGPSESILLPMVNGGISHRLLDENMKMYPLYVSTRITYLRNTVYAGPGNLRLPGKDVILRLLKV